MNNVGASRECCGKATLVRGAVSFMQRAVDPLTSMACPGRFGSRAFALMRQAPSRYDATAPRDRHDEEDHADQEQDPRDLTRDRGDAVQTERPGDETDDQEDERIVEHLELPS